VRCIAESVPHSLSPLPGAGGSIRLRSFEPADLPTIIEIVAEALRERYDASLYFSLRQAWPEGFLVAVDPRERPVGFLLGVSQIEREGRILMFAVDRSQRTHGVGSALMGEFLQRSRAKGLRRATLEVRVGNVTAIRFYSRFQFSVVDLLRAYYSDGENGYQMARDLP
jgi:ribosomal-protein-alanine N-acetyltransferase